MSSKTDRDLGGAMSVDSAARYLEMSADTIRRAIRSTGGPGTIPHLPAKRVQGRIRIARRDLDAWFLSWEDA